MGFEMRAQSANTIMQRYQENARIDFLTSEIEYHNHSKRGRVQTRRLRQFIKRRPETQDCYKLTLRFEEPADVRGTATLTIQNNLKDDQQWLYLPVLRRARQISPSRMTDRFMGTEMTYEDINKYLSEPRGSYAYRVVDKETVNGSDCIVIEALPVLGTERKNSGYSKRLLWINNKNYTNVKTLFYDKSGQELKVYEAFGIEKVKGANHYRPKRATMKNLKTGNWTEIFYHNLQVNKAIPDRTFTLAYLEEE
tara:strand:+ start:15825 stop:16580 length:756 start_codon:yes stop_codon:yes gene_type:complete